MGLLPNSLCCYVERLSAIEAPGCTSSGRNPIARLPCVLHILAVMHAGMSLAYHILNGRQEEPLMTTIVASTTVASARLDDVMIGLALLSDLHTVYSPVCSPPVSIAI